MKDFKVNKRNNKSTQQFLKISDFYTFELFYYSKNLAFSLSFVTFVVKSLCHSE